MTTNPTIGTIFFDLGKVLVDFDHFQIAEKLCASAGRRNGLPPERIFEWIFHPTKGLCSAFDSGRLTPQSFYSQLCGEFSLTLPFPSFVRIWNEIFTENVDVTRMVRELSGNYRLILISNTNPLHFKHIVENFAVLQYFESFILSYEVGVCKPDERIYQAALTKAGSRPDQTVYIDDIGDYIESARRLGVFGIQFTCSEELRKSLGRLLAFEFSCG